MCIFFQDKSGFFMYLPPLGKKPDTSVITRCFAIMDQFNANSSICRIENVEEEELIHYSGFAQISKSGDYLYSREDIIFLKGNKYKSQRSAYNHFSRHYKFQFRPFIKEEANACLSLYRAWARERKRKFGEAVYEKMLEDSFSSHKIAVENSASLGLIGYVIKVNTRLAGYTFGFPLNDQTFCILFEVCDLVYKGIAAFIFSYFCRQVPGFCYINTMDDSGLENLFRIKQAYRPLRIVPNYIIRRP